MGRVARVDWKQVHDDDFRVPSGLSLADLTADLTALLGDPDPHQRDGIALPVLATWIERGVYDDLLRGLGDGMAAGLRRGLGEQSTDSVFRRSFSALILAECISRDNARPLVPGGKVLEWGDRLASWLLSERDTRGFVPDKGWAHAIAHGADAIGVLAASPHVGGAELIVLLEVIGERVVTPVDVPFGAGEPDRLAAATLAVLKRERIGIDTVEMWLVQVVDGARKRRRDLTSDPYRHTGNLDAYLRALYLQLALGPNPPAVRADLLLLLVDSLRLLSPHFMGRSTGD
jgi:hypothetical protein